MSTPSSPIPIFDRSFKITFLLAQLTLIMATALLVKEFFCTCG